VLTAMIAQRGRAERRLRALAGPALMLVATAFLGCASGHKTSASSPLGDVVLYVDNDLDPPSDVRVYALAQDRRQFLGTVGPSRQGTFPFRWTGPGVTFTLIAQRPVGDAVVAQPISLTPNLAISWKLQGNSVYFPADPGS